MRGGVHRLRYVVEVHHGWGTWRRWTDDGDNHTLGSARKVAQDIAEEARRNPARYPSGLQVRVRNTKTNRVWWVS